MKRVGLLLSAITWLLVAGSVVIITGGMFGRPLLLAAVPTGSMAPALVPGDLIVVMPTWVVQAPGIGDIVVFKTPADQQWVVHRIVDGNAADGFVTKGDANRSADPNRVVQRDMAGVVPQWNGRALRLSRLGMLSIDSGPLSSPVVAGVALVMGVYLLVLDVRPQVRLPRLGKQRSTRLTSEAVISMYVGLAGTAFLTTLIPAWTLSSRQIMQYEVVATRPANVQRLGQFLVGGKHAELVPVDNPSPLPLVVVFSSPDPHLKYEPAWGVIPPRGQLPVTLTVAEAQLGTYRSPVEMGVFLPLLPPVWLARLAGISTFLAAMVSAAVPALLVVGIALLDRRTRNALARVQVRIGARF